MEYKIIKNILEARIAGTGIHLSLNETDEIGYNKKKIWGLKVFLKLFINNINNFVLKFLPHNPHKYRPVQLDKPLKHLCKRMEIPLFLYNNQVNQYKATPEVWNSLDDEQKTGMYLNAFLMTLEDYGAESAEDYFMKMGPKPNFRKAEFAFNFRAWVYTKYANEYFFKMGFANLEKRTFKKLIEVYKEEFLEKPAKKAEKTYTEEEVLKFSELKSRLDPQNSIDDILSAIKYIQENKIVECIDNVEYLLSHNDDRIQELALDAVMELKGFEA